MHAICTRTGSVLRDKAFESSGSTPNFGGVHVKCHHITRSIPDIGNALSPPNQPYLDTLTNHHG